MSEDIDAVHVVEPAKPEPIRVTIPPRWYQLPGAALGAGAFIGFVRGSRESSLRFLAENVHRPPTTVQGWYFYNKTKNYRVILGGLKRGGRDGAALAATAAGWVAIEEGVKRLGGSWEAATEVVAGLGTGVIFSVLYRLPLKTARRTVILGGSMGALISLLSVAQGRLNQVRAGLAVEAAKKEREAVERENASGRR